jgi:ribosomal protein S18 acetylase RimI-like enzyme
MKLELKRFQQEFYAEYASWFADPDLNHHLGPMDQEWLDVVLSQAEWEGITWAVFHDLELVAVFDPEHRLLAAVTALAIKPGLRRQGIGTSVLQQVLSLHKSKGIIEHVAYVSIYNSGGRRCLEKAGFTAVTAEPNEYGYIMFRHHLPM